MNALTKGKSPYLNDCFYKMIGGTSTSTCVVSNGQASSNASSAKSNRKSA